MSGFSGERQHSAKEVRAGRANAPHTSMFVRMLVRAAVLRRGRAAAALFAMVVAAAVATAMLNLYVDVEAKLQREFRNYGVQYVPLFTAGWLLMLVWIRNLWRFYARVAKSNFPAIDCAISPLALPLFVVLLYSSWFQNKVLHRVGWKGRTYQV